LIIFNKDWFKEIQYKFQPKKMEKKMFHLIYHSQKDKDFNKKQRKQIKMEKNQILLLKI